MMSLCLRSAFVWSVLASCVGVLPAAEPAAGDLVWLGTSPLSKVDGPAPQGIYVARFDRTTGRLSSPVVAAEIKNPSFLAMHPKLEWLYAVCPEQAPGEPGGAITAFRIDTKNGLLTRHTTVSSGGAGPCHVCVDSKGKVVLAANYGGGSAVCRALADDGSLRPAVDTTPGGFVQHVDDRADTSGIDPKRQEKPHAHSVDAASDGRFAFVCDLGLDTVFVYRLDNDAATLTPHGHASLPPGSGPRHLAIHPSGRFAWCINELSLTVTGFAYDAKAGALTTIETLPTLPDNVIDRRGFTCAEIAVHPTGKFLYASTRGHDSITSYRIDEKTGRLECLGVEPTRAATPRHFAISPDGRFLLAAGQSSHNVTTFAIDDETGTLSFTGHSVDVPAPSCILFGR